MEFGLLGPLQVVTPEGVVAIGSPKHRILLATLLLRARRPVPVDDLVEAIWGDDPPAFPQRTVQVYVSRLRSQLDGLALTSQGSAYRLDVPRGQLDIDRFEDLLDQTAGDGPAGDRAAGDRAAGDRAAGDGAAGDRAARDEAALVEALALWRGEPLADVPSDRLQREAVPRLRERWWHAIERRIDIDLQFGRYAELIGELTALTAREPLRERLWAQLMTALDRVGRRADALAAYETIRRQLAAQLGVDPGADLRRVHTEVLAGRPWHPAAPVPRQLPPDVRGFAGRIDELTALDALLQPGQVRGGQVRGGQVRGGQVSGGQVSGGLVSGGLVLGAITGTAGVGKTTLALHWARRVADEFPDGQLWIDLRGFGPGPAVPPEQALTRFLRAFGVPDAQIPVDLEDQSALYRSVLDGRRVLVVLDNAGSAGQVRPLLPGAPGCLALVTSRDQVTGLAAIEGVQLVPLDRLSAEEALQLLAQRLGEARVRAERAAVDEIISRCARLPLALAVMAAQAAAQPRFPLHALAEELRDGTLMAFHNGDPASDVRAVFSWSHRRLSPGAARLFRLLAAHPGPDLTAPAAASLAGVPVAQARTLLAELARAHLYDQPVPGRYACHDLLRAYSAELAGEEPDETQAAARRVLDHYLQTASVAARLLNPRPSMTFTPLPPARGVRPERLSTSHQALVWFDAELPVLLAAVARAAATGFDQHAWEVGQKLSTYALRSGHWHDAAAVQRIAVQAARRLADPVAEALAVRQVGRALVWLDRVEDGRSHFEEALRLAADDPVFAAHVYLDLGWVDRTVGDIPAALDHGEQAYRRYVAAGHRVGEANALNSIGWFYVHFGDPARARDYCERALAIQREIGDNDGAAATLHSLGLSLYHLGRLPESISCYRQSIELCGVLGERYYEATALNDLGDAYRAAADPDAAQTAYKQALAVLEELDHPDAAGVRAKLNSPNG